MFTVSGTVSSLNAVSKTNELLGIKKVHKIILHLLWTGILKRYFKGSALDKMRIVVVQEEDFDGAHGILSVYVNNNPYVLDNQFKQILPSRKVHYCEQFFMEKEKYWRHHCDKSSPALPHAAERIKLDFEFGVSVMPKQEAEALH